MPVYAISTETVRQLDWTPLVRHMPERMEKAGKYRFERDRLLCIGGGFLMRMAAGIRDESELCRGPYGKLSAPGYSYFNLSHSGEYCILAKSDSKIGVDIERIGGNDMIAAPVVFTPRELTWMKNEPDRFYQLWTLKESLLKAIGMGMSLDPDTVDVLPFIEKQSIFLNGQSWYAASDRVTGYRFSVCTTSPISGLDWVELGLSDFACN